VPWFDTDAVFFRVAAQKADAIQHAIPMLELILLPCSGSGQVPWRAGFVIANRNDNPYLGTSIDHLHRDAIAPKIEGKRRPLFRRIL